MVRNMGSARQALKKGKKGRKKAGKKRRYKRRKERYYKSTKRKEWNIQGGSNMTGTNCN
jgi:hypothetical protein